MSTVQTRRRELEEVRHDAADCTRCDLFRNATQTVFGEGRTGAELMLLGEHIGEMSDVVGKVLAGSPSDADVQVVPLANAPAVTFHVAAEEELGHRRVDAVMLSLQPEFRFLRDDRLRRVAATAQVAGDGAEMSAGPDDGDFVVHAARLYGPLSPEGRGLG